MSDQPNHVTLADAYTRIRDAAVDAAIHFSNAEVRNNAISGENRELSRVAFSLRDAVTYRFDSLLYHPISSSNRTRPRRKPLAGIMNKAATSCVRSQLVNASFLMMSFSIRSACSTIWVTLEVLCSVTRVGRDCDGISSTSGPNTHQRARLESGTRFTGLEQRPWLLRQTRDGCAN